MQYKAKVKGTGYDININNDLLALNEKNIEWDLIRIDAKRFHIIRGSKSYEAELVEIKKEEKIILLKINNKLFEVELKDQYDELLHNLGMDSVAANKLNDLKAPMPGMVLKVLVKEGDEIMKGDSLIVLEAMKMENMLKAAGNGKVKSIKVKISDKVEKNEVLIVFE